MAFTIATNTMSSTEASATPSLAEPSTAAPTLATAESNQTSLNSSDGEEDSRSRSNSRTLRPHIGARKSSGTMIIPADHPDVEIKEESYPADDARAMSPRRSSADTERMVQEARQVAETHAIEKQSGINALIERIESVKAEHDKLERNNNALQDYIGGLHRSMSRTALDTGRKK